MALLPGFWISVFVEMRDLLAVPANVFPQFDIQGGSPFYAVIEEPDPLF